MNVDTCVLQPDGRMLIYITAFVLNDDERLQQKWIKYILSVIMMESLI